MLSVPGLTVRDVVVKERFSVWFPVTCDFVEG